mgnify:CR=1 FL=1
MFESYNFKTDALKFRANTYIFDFENNSFAEWFHRQGNPKVPFSSHSHADPEVLYIRKGSARFFINNEPFTLHENEAMVVNSYDLHRGSFINEELLEYSYTIFDLSLLTSCGRAAGTLVSELRGGMRRFSPVIRGSAADRIGEMIYNLCEISNMSLESPLSVCGEVRAAGMIFGIFSELVDHSELTKMSKKPHDTGFIELLSTYLDSNYTKPLTISGVSAELGYSKNYFCTLFKENFGQSFTNYLCEYRVKRAASVYKSGGMPLSELAAMVGFSDYCYFSRSFTKYIGVSPSAYFRK